MASPAAESGAALPALGPHGQPALSPSPPGVLVPSSALRSLELLDSSWLLTRIQRVGKTFSESRVPSQCPSVALAERNQAATLPVRLLKDSPAAHEDNDHARDSFQMKMDARGFAPEELVVQVDGQWLMVTGQRQMEGSDPERGSYSMSQKMHRKTRLPSNLNPTAMTCCLTPSGQLWVRGQCGALALPEDQTGPSLKLGSLSSKASKLTQ
ncbi:heat shock protein beta-9 [Saimiri boliviensis]|uniref:heat shock protein beta-9 n=1 Tax=Saimiri boliviensis TaxID=27679 RepID=UPI00193DA1B8|nr:heat shock protein beta-9 [Saimiri boliviensis boliviensis]